MGSCPTAGPEFPEPPRRPGLPTACFGNRAGGDRNGLSCAHSGSRFEWIFIELSPRGWVPKSGSTSTVFIQDAAGKRVLRLDYGYNKEQERLITIGIRKGRSRNLE